MDEWRQGRNRILITTLAIVVSLVSVVVCLAILLTRTSPTSWDEEISRYEDYLYIDGETLTPQDLDRIAALPRLEHLSLTNCNLSECRLSDLTFASKRLQYLDLSGTKGLWDLSFLSRVPATDLRLDNCTDVSDLSQLNLEVLEDLSIEGTGVTDLSPLAAGSQLHILSFANTGVSDISPLVGLDDLWKVDGSHTQVRDIDGLVRAKGLWSLRFDGCPIKKLGVSFGQTYFSEIGLADTQISDFGALAGCTGIDVLDLGGCAGLDDISWLDKSNYESLWTLNLAGTSLDRDDLSWVASCTNLTDLWLDGIELGDLSLCRKLSGLRVLSAVGCGITSVRDIAGCGELQTLLLGYNQIEDLSGLPHPEEDWASMTLDLSHNGLKSLRGLPEGEYLTLLLQGNDPELGRTMPAGVSCREAVLTWFPGIDDTALSSWETFGELYLLDCPADEEIETTRELGSYRTTLLDEERLWRLLEADELDYGLYVDMSRYVAYARAHG